MKINFFTTRLAIVHLPPLRCWPHSGHGSVVPHLRTGHSERWTRMECKIRGGCCCQAKGRLLSPSDCGCRCCRNRIGESGAADVGFLPGGSPRVQHRRQEERPIFFGGVRMSRRCCRSIYPTRVYRPRIRRLLPFRPPKEHPRLEVGWEMRGSRVDANRHHNNSSSAPRSFLRHCAGRLRPRYRDELPQLVQGRGTGGRQAPRGGRVIVVAVIAVEGVIVVVCGGMDSGCRSAGTVRGDRGRAL